MATNEYKVTQFVTREVLRTLHNRLKFIPTLFRDFDKEFAQKGKKIGDSLEIRLPNQFTVRSGNTLQTQSVSERTVVLAQSNLHGIDVEFNDVDFALSVDDLRKRFTEPMGKRLAGELEKLVLEEVAKDIHNSVGTPGTTPTDSDVLFDAQEKLDNFLVPDEDRYAILNPKARNGIIKGENTLYHPGSDLSNRYRKGSLGEIALFDCMSTPLIPTLTTGSRDNTTPLVNGASQSGASLVCDGFDATATIKKGDKFTIGSVYAINPETKAAYDFLQDFVVTADATCSGGAVTLSIEPSIITSGALQTVSVGPADNAALTFAGAASTAYPLNLGYHKEAFAFVSAALPMHRDSISCVIETWDNISIRVWIGSDINNNRQIMRMDVLWGVKTLRADQAVRIWG